MNLILIIISDYLNFKLIIQENSSIVHEDNANFEQSKISSQNFTRPIWSQNIEASEGFEENKAPSPSNKSNLFVNLHNKQGNTDTPKFVNLRSRNEIQNSFINMRHTSRYD